MHPLLRPGYAAVGQVARGLAASLPNRDSKLIRTFRARRNILCRYEAWGQTERRADRPLLWIHAPSVGEGLQARPVLELARAGDPLLQLAYTHFSPSAERFAGTIDADFIDYLPFDTPADGDAALAALRPSALVFAKLDVWPTLVERAGMRGVKTAVISATLPPRSRRRSALGRALLRDAYAQLDAVGAIAAEDADRLIELGVREHVITVTGDTRYDQVWQRAAAVDVRSALLGPLASERPTIVAGSTWPADEAILLPAFEQARAQAPGLRLIIAPHEPTPVHLASIEGRATHARLSSARLGTSAAANAHVVVVDRLGVLGELYAVADIAFVGGGFGNAGLHSVLEPAAFGAPVIFGPRTGGARDPELLAARGGGVVVRSAGALADRLREWVNDPVKRSTAGAQARAVVAEGLGAARATYALVRSLLPE